MADPTRLPAREAVRRLRAREVSPLELIDAALTRIAAVDPLVNAVPDALRRAGARACAAHHGRPCTRGSAGRPARADQGPGRGRGRAHHPRLADLRGPCAPGLGLAGRADRGRGRDRARQDEHARVRRRRQHLQRGVRHHPQPVGPALTCGGSSGGSAVALATGMAWLADGSDLGGSLRTPASFCGIVGLRPSPGRVPHGPGTLPFGTLAVNGPMARDVRDVALFLDVLAGFDPARPAELRHCLQRPMPKRSSGRSGFGAWRSRPTSAASRRSTPRSPTSAGEAAARFAELGAGVEDASPDLGIGGRGVHDPARRAVSPPPWSRCWTRIATASSPRWSGTSSTA